MERNNVITKIQVKLDGEVMVVKQLVCQTMDEVDDQVVEMG